MLKKVPSTSLPQHTSRASLVSKEKNPVGYFFEQPAYLTFLYIRFLKIFQFSGMLYRVGWSIIMDVSKDFKSIFSIGAVG